MSSEPPPTYSQDTPAAPTPGDDGSAAALQILVVPTADGINFQTGYLGADEERAAIEGELQIKGGSALRWRKVTMSLRTVERAHEREIELSNTEIVLSHSVEPSSNAARSSFPFSIPLPPDTPQCVHTAHSSLAHTLTATVYPDEDETPVLTKALTVHTRRYTSHQHELHSAPETRVMEEPARVEVQIPRSTFKVGEPIPIYVTVPTPPRDLVLEQGLRLRNVRAELVRFVNIKSDDTDLDDYDSNLPSESDEDTDSALSSSPPAEKTTIGPSTSAQGPDFIPSVGERGERKVMSVSGASCRLHPTRPLHIRLVLHQPSESPRITPTQELPVDDRYSLESPAECASISQVTLLHSVYFRLRVHATFMNMTHHTERVSTLSIPVIILPPSAPLPEVEHAMDIAYHKKHDRPPARTVRHDDAEVPHYDDGAPGPSINSGAPPPFEEREAPPPFFTASAEASTSSPLPTFLESESQVYVPPSEDTAVVAPPPLCEPVFEGEGTLFGFAPAAQFDGYADDMQRSFTPPPPLEMAARDTDVTGLANMDEGTAMEVLGLALDEHDEAASDRLPPPPPPMDDPSDPPPSIDSEFRAPEAQAPHSPRTTFAQMTETPAHDAPMPTGAAAESHAPPPYRVPDGENEHAHIVRPPPYMDLVLQSEHAQ
ncbi:hypothetical protein A0H81_00673 [Grifola frondosa]|uniref:Uncharacterized protein n=1 Tax=Grifola frondosa TaxID=5627 RepID=A0A1C7MSS1_GRIFR|nr:hypothetical protein A0H81_00673 [Grifola frondosa]